MLWWRCIENVSRPFTREQTNSHNDGAPLWTFDTVQANNCNGSTVGTNVPIYQWIPGKIEMSLLQINVGGNCNTFITFRTFAMAHMLFKQSEHVQQLNALIPLEMQRCMCAQMRLTMPS